jgi:uncharacterized protein YndB with AHSA1/START domain
VNHDQIEQEIFIGAPLETVWALVSQPAWWVGDKPGPDSVQTDGIRAVANTRFGIFPVLTEQMDPPNYLACRWASSFPEEEPREGNSTLIELHLTAKDGGTLVRVIENGFSSIAVPEEEQRKHYNGNVQGWKQQLEVLRKRAEH